MEGPENCNIDEIQEKDTQIAFMSMVDVPKDEMNKSLKELYETPTNSGNK